MTLRPNESASPTSSTVGEDAAASAFGASTSGTAAFSGMRLLARPGTSTSGDFSTWLLPAGAAPAESEATVSAAAAAQAVHFFIGFLLGTAHDAPLAE